MVLPLRIYSGRVCGDCTACCVYLPIAAGVISQNAKPAGEPCEKLCDSGCAIYEQRPVACSQFRCAWLADDDWLDEWRPDRAGLLCLRELLDDRLPAALVVETRRGALLEPQAESILLHLLSKTALVVVVGPDGKRRLMCGQYRQDQGGAALPDEQTPNSRVAA